MLGAGPLTQLVQEPGFGCALGAAFRRHLGVSIGEYLAQCRTAEAQRLLISTDGTTTDIALGAGFGSVSSFYERFVRDVGLAPAAYRRLVRTSLT